MTLRPVARVYALLAPPEEERECVDIPPELCEHQPRNFLTHVASLVAQKTGDGLADPKLVLAWLLTALGAPGWQIGLLVPIREAGALVPQLAIAGWIRSRPIRKWVWSVATWGQGLAVLGMALSGWRLEGVAAGAGILVSLGVFALFRSAASVSYKDVLGKTVSKVTRGSATGAAGSIAAALVFAFGVAVWAGWIPLTPVAICLVIAAAAGLWLVAGTLFVTLREVPGETEAGGDPLAVARGQLGLLRRDTALQRFIVVRGLLLATALSPPWLLELSGRGSPDRLGALGPFVIASSAAAVTSSWIWGRLADTSSRQVLIRAAWLATVVLGAVALLAALDAPLLGAAPTLPLMLYALMVAYQGVRVGRSTHVVDMATAETRAAYVALSNTSIGILLLAASGFGALQAVAGTAWVLGSFAVMCTAAGLAARGLGEVQAEARSEGPHG